jgi:phosphocarrier protein FPr
VPVLVGLGVDELSVGGRSIAEVKARIREISLTQVQTLARAALAVGSANEVRALVEAL